MGCSCLILSKIQFSLHERKIEARRIPSNIPDHDENSVEISNVSEVYSKMRRFGSPSDETSDDRRPSVIP